jgi:molybdopterin converting factor subunit 1
VKVAENQRKCIVMKIRIKAFASVKDTLGFNEREYNLLNEMTVGDAIKFISQEFDGMKALEENLLFAVNEEYCSGERRLKENDVLALFPPVSGG